MQIRSLTLIQKLCYSHLNISPECTSLVIGCYARISASTGLDMPAVYTGDYNWNVQAVGNVPICNDGHNAQGKRIFKWNSKTLTGQVTKFDDGYCGDSPAGTSTFPFFLVKA